jgi:hypothetical protein
MINNFLKKITNFFGFDIIRVNNEIKNTEKDLVEVIETSSSDLENLVRLSITGSVSLAALGGFLWPENHLLINSDKFESTFNYKFAGTPESITQDVSNIIEVVKKSKRSQGKEYE